MANKVQFGDGFGDKPQIKKGDKILIADADTGAPFKTTVEKLSEDKVTKEEGKSLVSDSAITKLNDLPNKTQLDTSLNNKVNKELNKSLVADTDIAKLNALPSKTDLDSSLDLKVDKVQGKELSDNNYNDTDKSKVDGIYTNGDGKFFLSDDGTYKKLNSNGGGFYNVTAKHPLASGQYYNINTAVGALANAEIEDADKEALIITFSTSANNWTEYRFIGDISGFLTVANWVEYVDRDVVKGVLFNDEQLNPDSNGNIILDINTNVEQTINPNSTDPVASSAVASEFAGLSAKYGASLSLSTVGDPEDKVYQMNLLDENGNVLSTTDQFSGGGSGGEVTTTKVVLNKLTPNPTVKKGDLTELSFSYDHIDSTNETSTGLAGKAIITILSGALSKSREMNLNAGSTTTLDVTNDLIVGNNTVRVRVEVDNGESIQVSTISWSVLVVNLVLTSNYDYATATAKGTTIYVPYTLAGAGNKTLKCYVNGLAFDSKSITTSNSNGSFAIPTSIYNHGNIDVQLVAELETNTGAIIKSNSIYYDLIITQSGNNTPVVATKFNYQDGTILASDEKPYLSSRQLEDYTIQYAVYHPNQINKLVIVKVDGNTISTANVSFVQSKVTYRSVVAGTFNAVINVGSYNYQFNIAVSPSSVALTEPSDNMVFKFNAQAKSNNDIGKETWLATNGVTTATLSGVKFGGDGWLNNTLKLTDNGRCTINYKPLDASNRLTNNAFTYQVRFRISEVVNENAQVIKCVDSEGTGFVITATEAKMVTRGRAEVGMKIASNEIYNITFVSYPTANNDSSEHEKVNDRISYLYINGIQSGMVQKASADQIYQTSPQFITMGANGATLEVFNTRHYNRYLNDGQVLDLHIIDLDSVDEIIAKFNANAIIDGNGNITVDNIDDDMRYIIITGQEANGVPSVLESAVQNNKDRRYDVTEILHIKKSEPHLNFRLIGGCIRLQGTSSLQYSRKNYRIYFKNSAKVAGQLYTGVDAQGNGGTLQSKAKFSFKTKADNGKKPMPVDVWCLKVDFASSEGSHNTGGVRLFNNILQQIGDLTPAQKHVDPNYEFDVRTAIDGEPCYIFYRATVEDEPIFLCKGNMNNDKSSEDLFGFQNIPNYHTKEIVNPETQLTEIVPSDWITNKFGGENPIQMWELLNNDFAHGNWQDDDFDRMVNVDGVMVPDWTRVFEARFPDNHDDYVEGIIPKPFYLERLSKWIKSTQTDLPKFKAELKDYFDVNYLCDYFVITQLFALVDSMVKNSMLGFWYSPEADKMLAYYVFYDADTQISLRNDGRIRYHWDVDRNTLDPELSTPQKPSYAFMGHDNILWNNLEAEFQTEIGEAYRRIRAKLTNDEFFKFYDKQGSDKYVERVFNIDAMNKYVLPATLGIDAIVNGQVEKKTYQFLESGQGSRKSHRQWWMTNRFHLFDARYGTGLYQSTDLAWKGFSSAGARIKATASRDFYFRITRESTVMTHSKVLAGQEWSYTYPSEANIGTIFHFYGGVFVSKLDMSLWGGFADLNIPRLPVLEELVLGAEGRTYSLSAINITDKVPMMKKLDIRNYIELPSLDLSLSNRLEELTATGCSTLSTINFASGAPIKRLVLPNNLKTLHLNNFAQLANSGITFPNGNNVQVLNIENCPLINWQSLYTSMANTLTHVRIDGIDLTGGVSFFNQFSDKGGISETGTLIDGKPALVGKYQFTTYVEETQFEALKAKYPYLELKQPEYSEVLMYDLDPLTKDIVIDTKNIFNPENNTGYGTVNKYQPSGHILRLLNSRHRYLGKQGNDGVMNIIQLHDSNSFYYADASNIANATPALLDGSQGDVFIKEPKYWYRGINDVENGVNYIQVSSNDSKPSIHSSNIRITQAEFTTLGNIEGNFYLDSDKATSLTNAKTANSDYMIVKVNVEGFKFVKFPMTSQAYANLYNGTVIKCSSMFTDGADSIIKVMAPSSDDIEYNPKYAVAIPANAKWLYISMKKVHFSDDVMLTKGTKIQDVECDWIEHKPTLIGAVKSSITGNKVRSISGGAISELPKDLIDPYYTNKGVTRMVYDDYKNVAILSWLKYGERKTNDVFGQLEMQNITTGAQLYGTALQYGMMDTIEHPTLNHNGNGYPARKYVDEFGVTQYQTVSAVLTLGYENWTASEYSRFKEILFDGLPYQGNSKIRTFNVGTPMERNVHEFRPFQGIPRKRVLGKYLDIFPMGTKLGSQTTFYSEGNDWYNEGDRRYMVIGYSNGQTGYSIGDINLHNESKISARIVFRGVINEISNAVNYKNISGWK